MRWTVAIDGRSGSLTTDTGGTELADATGLTADRVSSDTVRIHLTAAQMRRFLADRAGNGVVVRVSDGTNLSIAQFTAA